MRKDIPSPLKPRVHGGHIVGISMEIFILLGLLCPCSARACGKDRPGESPLGFIRPIEIDSLSGYTFPRSVVGVSGYNSDCKPSLTANGHQIYFISADNNGPPYSQEHVGTGFNVYVARWNGAAWDSVTNLGPNVNPASYACISPDGGNIYFTRGNDIWTSTYDGHEWTPAEILPSPVNDPFASDRAPFLTADGRRLYFASNRHEGHGSYDLWVVRRNGTAWDSLANLGPAVNTVKSETHPALTPDGSTLYFTDFGGPRDVWKYGDADLYVSRWTGTGWGPPEIVGAPVNSDHPLCSSFPMPDGRLYLGSGVSEGGFGEEDIWMVEPDSLAQWQGVEGRPGPNEWARIATLEGALNVLCLAEDRDGTLYAGTAPGGDVFRSTDSGETWENTSDLPGAIQVYSLLETSDGSLYAGTYPHGDVFRSTDRGDTWLPTGEMPNATAVRALLESSEGSLLAGTSPDSMGWGRIYRSDDAGSTWIRTGLVPDVKGGIFTLMEGDGGAIFAGGRVSGDRIFVSSNNGSSWTEINLPYDDQHVTISNTYFFRRTSGGTIWAGGWAHGPQGMLVHSTDNGATWDTTASIFTGPVEAALIYDMVEETGGSLLIGYHPGPDSIVQRSTDGGVTWESAGILRGAREVLCLLRTSQGDILAGTSADGGIYREPTAGIEIKGRRERTPRAIGMGQNFPNPFNPGTSVRYTVPDAAAGRHVSISIYDMRGRLVRNLVDCRQPAGQYTVRWNGLDDEGLPAASGGYFCRIEAGGFSSVRKMLLAR